MPANRFSDGVYARPSIYENLGDEPAIHPDVEALFREFAGSPILLSIMVQVASEMADYGLNVRSDDGGALAARVIRKRMTHRDAWFDSTPAALEQRAAIERSAGTSLVYYVDLYGSAIKIGTSTNVLKRLSQLRRESHHLLAVEPGGYAVENKRHRQFSRERHESGREDFSRSPRLLDHIARLNAIHGAPFDFLEQIGRRTA